MRVIAGSSRGRTLRAPPGSAVRPTSDRVREAIFDVVAGLVDLDGAAVADLFAGTGALGIEALSRGAGSAVFVDREPVSLRTISSNLVSAGLEDSSTTLVRADVVKWLSRRRPPGGGPAGGQRDAFDLVLLDPPYGFSDWDTLLGLLEAHVAVLESDRPIEVPERFNVTKTKRYGGTLVTVVRAAGTSVR